MKVGGKALLARITELSSLEVVKSVDAKMVTNLALLKEIDEGTAYQARLFPSLPVDYQ